MKTASHVKDYATSIRRHRVTTFADGVLQPAIDKAAHNGEETTAPIDVPANIDMDILKSLVENYGYTLVATGSAPDPVTVTISWSTPSTK